MTQVDVTQRIISDLSQVKIAVDLTPMLPGGENGGAKLITVELVNALARLLPKTDFVLLTAESSHAQLDWLEKDHANIRRICVLHNTSQTSVSNLSPVSLRKKAFYRLKTLVADVFPLKLKERIITVPSSLSVLYNRALNQLKVFLPLRFRQRIKSLLRVGKPTTSSESLLRQIGANLLFCPFTAPYYADPLIPTVSVIYDLQYRAYPQFFTPEEVVERENNFRMACQKASYIVAISEFVRQTIIEAAKFAPERVIAVLIGLLRNPENPKSEENLGEWLLQKYGLRQGEYIFYPANFWQHKNHAMLLTAFNMYRQATPDSKLKLLCAGAPGRGAEAFCEAARRMGLSDWVIYPGYLAPDECDLLLRSAFALIFPSLYEGFGVPVLEAMSAGVPALCSHVTSLPEVGGDAVVYFDPRRPSQIVDALTRLSNEPNLREDLIIKGLQRAELFAGADRMAFEYAQVFVKALFLQTNSQLDTGNSVASGGLN